MVAGRQVDRVSRAAAEGFRTKPRCTRTTPSHTATSTSCGRMATDVRRLTEDAYEHGTLAFFPVPDRKVTFAEPVAEEDRGHGAAFRGSSGLSGPGR